MDVKKFFKPNTLKVVMGIFLIIISFEVLWNFTEAAIIIFPVSILIGYLIACAIDHFVKSRAVKMIIAVVLVAVAIVLGWFSLVRNIVVCDPVHRPEVCDPVHQP